MKTLRREEKIRLTLKDANTYEVTNRNGEVVLGADQDYFIYFKNANFMKGFIEGRYLGEADERFLRDCYKNAYYKDGQFWTGGKVVKTARLVAVRNKDRAVIVIPQE